MKTIAILLLLVSSVRAQTPEQKKQTIQFLQNLQADDGSFVAAPIDPRLDQKPRGGLRATSGAIRALKYFGGEPASKEAAAKFVQSCWNDKMGGFADQPGGKVDVATTAVGLMAVAELGLPLETYRDRALDFMAENAKQFEEVRMAAAGMEAAGKRHPKGRDWLSDLQNKANSDGSYGEGAEIARATGGTIAAILRLGGKPVGPASAIDILNKHQNKDGGFGKDNSGSSDLETTYRVMRCYHMLKAKPSRVEALRLFVEVCRNADGGYGVQPGKPSTAAGTYFAGIIIKWLHTETR